MSTRKELSTVAVISIGFLLFFFLFKNEYFLYVSGATVVLGFLSPFFRKYLIKFWFQLGFILGYINSRILLSLVFFLILCPLAFLKKLFTKNDKFCIKKKEGNQSYFQNRAHCFTKTDFEQPW